MKQLEQEMPVIDEITLKSSIMGGIDPNDCMWRCFAYIQSNGTHCSATDAEALAAQYYGSGFNSTSYGFTGTESQAEALAGNVLGSAYVQNSKQILVFNPNNFPNWQGNGISHAVIVTGYSNGQWQVFDPQNNISGVIDAAILNQQTSGTFFM